MSAQLLHIGIGVFAAHDNLLRFSHSILLFAERSSSTHKNVGKFHSLAFCPCGGLGGTDQRAPKKALFLCLKRLRNLAKNCDGEQGETLTMPDSEVQINFDVPATLRKWPSVNNERVSASLGARPYLIIDGTLDECIRKFMSQPISQRHLYEIHTAPQSDLVSSVLSGEHIVELARLRDFL